MNNKIFQIGKIYYTCHPKYQRFGASKAGIVVKFPSGKQIEEDDDGNIKVRSCRGRDKVYSKIAFIWESHRGLMKKNEYVSRINGNSDEIINLKLEKKVRKLLTLEEKLERNAQNRAKWMNKPWDCPDCGFCTTNSVKWNHKRVCKYSVNPLTEAERLKRRKASTKWNHTKFTCIICGNQYNNSYKSVHTYFCEKKHCVME